MSADIPLRNSCLCAIVDDEMLAAVSAYRWAAQRADQNSENFYAYAYADGRKIYLHRFILKPPRGALADHKNGNGLDNRLANLRVATRGQNNVNRRVNNLTGFRGVEPNEARNRFRAVLFVGSNKRINLGNFDSAVEAAVAFDKAALARWGEFAWLNFPRATPEAGAAR